jgi:hypothetical protein
MKMKLLTLCAAALIGVAAEPNRDVEIAAPVVQANPYFAIGAGPLPIPLPNFAFGYRTQNGHFGMDYSIQVATIIEATQLQGNVLFNYYPKPSLTSQAYLGFGVTPGVFFQSGRWATPNIAPAFVIGKQYRNESNDLRFFQAQINFPTVAWKTNGWRSCWGWDYSHHKVEVLKMPLLTISYGWGF